MPPSLVDKVSPHMEYRQHCSYPHDPGAFGGGVRFIVGVGPEYGVGDGLAGIVTLPGVTPGI